MQSRLVWVMGSLADFLRLSPGLTSWSKTIALCNGVSLFKSPSFWIVHSSGPGLLPSMAPSWATGRLGHPADNKRWECSLAHIFPLYLLFCHLPIIKILQPNSRHQLWAHMHPGGMGFCPPPANLLTVILAVLMAAPGWASGPASQQDSSQGMRDWSCFGGTEALWLIVLELVFLQSGLDGMSQFPQPTSPMTHNSNPHQVYSSAFMVALGLAVLCTFSIWGICVRSRIALS